MWINKLLLLNYYYFCWQAVCDSSRQLLLTSWCVTRHDSSADKLCVTRHDSFCRQAVCDSSCNLSVKSRKNMWIKNWFKFKFIWLWQNRRTRLKFGPSQNSRFLFKGLEETGALFKRWYNYRSLLISGSILWSNNIFIKRMNLISLHWFLDKSTWKRSWSA